MDTLKLDYISAEGLLENVVPGEIRNLDFSNVAEIDFGGMRALIQAFNRGLKFCIVNASPAVELAMDNAGLTKYISVCNAPIEIDLSHFTKSGEGLNGVSYNGDDGATLLKLYNPFVPPSLVEQEKRIATRAFQLGIPTPLAGEIVSEGEQRGLLYERIVGKKSFARAISQEPDHLGMYAERFASMCRTLHQTPCDTVVFPDVVDYYENVIRSNGDFSDAEKDRMMTFLHDVPKAATCLHGDMHIGNVITTGKEDLWIDMSDFSYGNPLFDLGMFFLACHCNPDEMTMDLYHVDNATMRSFWDIFIRHYYEGESDASIAEKERSIAKFAALKMVYYANIGTMVPSMKYFIQSQLL